MRRRAELLSIGSGVLHSFVSRNSEIDGYWAIGKLYSHAKAAQALTVRINLLSHEFTPEKVLLKRLHRSLNIAPLIVKYEATLRNLVARRKLPADWLSAAILTLEFESGEAQPPYSPIEIGTMPFLCTLEITDDLGNNHVLRTSGWCRPHNPWIESASARRSEAT